MGAPEKKRILCVEDEPDICRMISVILQDNEIESASTKAEAIEMARTGRFALILLDYWLPDGTGEEACKHIRSFDKRTPILFVTGSQTFSETRARALGAQGTLKKAQPNFLEELQNRTVELC